MGSEVAALIAGDFDRCQGDRDVIVEHRNEGPKKISTLHPLYMAFQYPVLFPYADPGFSLEIPYVDSPIKKAIKRQSVTMRSFG
ncbi:ATP-dependent DNA helicase PIF1 [Corchorus olitorius]|uniref:ATP-dependent DNA helicase PIF1 n=1 Tax=Corchorus olitorius TaxID=93759 RepID=A0A1R3GLH8_9ROSI|nr:ATP-dependent DNA helicase PIF1 [Corchorus olitorius]